MRHAKSSWKESGGNDFNRPLNNRGERDAPFMGKLLRIHNPRPDIIVTSSARRALTTASMVAHELSYPEENIVTDTNLYGASSVELVRYISGTDDRHRSLLLIAHNPGLTYALNILTGSSIDNIPTCGLAAVDWNVSSWKATGNIRGTIRFFEYPKKYFPSG